MAARHTHDAETFATPAGDAAFHLEEAYVRVHRVLDLRVGARLTKAQAEELSETLGHIADAYRAITGRLIGDDLGPF